MFSLVKPVFYSTMLRAIIGPPGNKYAGPEQKDVDIVVSHTTRFFVLAYSNNVSKRFEGLANIAVNRFVGLQCCWTFYWLTVLLADFPTYSAVGHFIG